VVWAVASIPTAQLFLGEAMKIDFLIWNGVMYVPIQHDWILDEINIIKTGVSVKLNKKPEPEKKPEEKK
jgi:hypothetical protein